ncbi:hypothetical protein ABID21_001472 [Pseudorhizobium tarimense]|uniref:Uncharacterized protein n=1 Tax=Pseudorhizobium tarimense TaxID=1079109 RepID=A0ABV2H499_9HYPH
MAGRSHAHLLRRSTRLQCLCHYPLFGLIRPAPTKLPRGTLKADHRRFAFGAAGGDHVALGERPDFGLDAHGCEVLLDRLGDARLRIGLVEKSVVSKPSA